MKYLALILFFLSTSVFANDAVDCTLYTQQQEDFVTFPDCISQSDNPSLTDANIKPQVLDAALYDQTGLSFLFSKLGVYYFTKTGLARRTHIYDNGPDYFEEGLARTIKNEKFGYINTTLAIVIEPIYDFGFPFKGGKALVCIGCKTISNGEHSEVVGGEWFSIDTKGHKINPASNDTQP